MTWKAIGYSAIGTAHSDTDKGCEDAVAYHTLALGDGTNAFIAAISDGAGSATFAAQASRIAVATLVNSAIQFLNTSQPLTESTAYELAEQVYETLRQEAEKEQSDLTDFSCTLLAAIVLPKHTLLMQVGDGAIIRGTADDNYALLWWPQSGEYHNTTHFITDDPLMPNLQIALLDEQVHELAMFTDGLQMLCLSSANRAVHTPFFTPLFQAVRQIETEEQNEILVRKLADYLNSAAINSRTDDDKTLLLATLR